MKINEILFENDQNKVVNAVTCFSLGSYQIGEIARISGLLYSSGVDVVKLLEKKHKEVNHGQSAD
ncbi:hypothetical protein [Amphibacillus jilinensis]|uniref:hypothetical protein n=1 Tax=Amphibacillus jilinensis TaxID=1216008 RepID=UPI0002FC9AC0|nr:hypothetical protein [Amphibacillus jilinensis]